MFRPSDPPKVVETPVKPPVETSVKPPVETTVKPPVETAVKPPVETTVKPPVETPVKPPVETPVKPPVEAVANSLLKVKVPEDAKTIAKAIELCKDGGTVEIAGGTYRESIQLNKSISLIAASSAVLEYDKSNVITAHGPIKVTLRNLQIKNPLGDAKLPADKSPALVVIYEGAVVHFDACELEKSNGDGVSVVKKAGVKFSNSRIHDNRGYGVNVRDGSSVEMSFSEVRKNGSSGISIVNGGSKGTLGNNTIIKENSTNGVEVGNGATLECKGVTITQNEKSGLTVETIGTKVKLESSCVISENKQHGIIAADAVRLTMSDSTCSDNKDYGLHLTKGAAAEITSCHFKSNGLMGIYQEIGTSGTVKVSKTDFKSHLQAAVVVGEGTGEVADCVFSANTLAVLFDENAGGIATGNRIKPGPLAEVLIMENPAKVRAENNTIDPP